MINKVELESFLNKVRNCHDDSCKVIPCEVGNVCTPFVYGKTTSDILVVSEAPPPDAWRQNKGKMWEHTMNITQNVTDVQSKLARWLDIVPVAEERLFWIQRANCCVAKEDWDSVYKHCGKKFLSDAVELVNPKLIVTLGGIAAGYFYPKFKSMKDLMDQRINSGLKPKIHQSYEMFPFYHPAGRAEIYRQANIELHYKMEELAREKIRASVS